jgi:hypothetical protein
MLFDPLKIMSSNGISFDEDDMHGSDFRVEMFS